MRIKNRPKQQAANSDTRMSDVTPTTAQAQLRRVAV